MTDDDDQVPLSAIQHYSYCPRQCALIHVEQVFDENLFTMKGRWAHDKVDVEHVRSANGYRIVTALPVWSDKYGLVGKCDVVELRGETPYPVEFKHGPRKGNVYDDLQLCAQAICLEEMFGVSVTEGAIYHISSRRRRVVQFTDNLRNQVLTAASGVRALRTADKLPPAVNDERCVHCSLQDVCMPQWTHGHGIPTWQQAVAYLEQGESVCTSD